MTLEAKVTTIAANPGDDAGTLTVQVYDDAAPAVIIWEGPVIVQLDHAPERISEQLDKLLERIEFRRGRIATLQALIGRARRRRA